MKAFKRKDTMFLVREMDNLQNRYSFNKLFA